MINDREYLQDIADDSIRKVHELVAQSKRYLDALGEIASCGDQANAIYLIGVARAAIDGASTTADKYNNKERYVCIHNVPKNVECPMCNTSEDRWHDTNAQVVAYDKSMEEE